jgi:hypothetical protein
MADLNFKEQSKAGPQGSRQNRGSQSTARRTGGGGQRSGSSSPLLFSLNPRDSHCGVFETCWWVSAPRTER